MIHDPDHKIKLYLKSTLCKDEDNSFRVTKIHGGILDRLNQPS